MLRITTERLMIRQFTIDDWKDLQDYIGEKRVLMFESPWETSEASLRADCDYFSKGTTFLAVELKESGKMIGHIYFNKAEPMHFEHYALGYIFNPNYYGKGYATEACKAVVDYGFTRLNMHRVFAKCHPENIASWKVLDRLSFRKEGYTVKSYYIKKDEEGNPLWWDEYLYAMTKEEYQGYDISISYE